MFQVLRARVRVIFKVKNKRNFYAAYDSPLFHSRRGIKRPHLLSSDVWLHEADI